jgi:hypothetical protein
VSGVSRKSGNVVYGILCDFYSSPFLALDSFTEVLAKEVLPAWNIRVRNLGRDI